MKTVGQLIEDLQKFDPDMRVVLKVRDEEQYIEFHVQDDPVVYLDDYWDEFYDRQVKTCIVG